MVSRRNIILALAILLFSMIALTACTMNGSFRIGPGDIAKQVGTHYGDPHAQITKVISTQTELPSQEPMYAIALVGHFHKGTVLAHSLSFSALASKMHVWNIYAFNQINQEVWHDFELAS